MNVVKPRTIAGVVGAISTAALGASIAPAVAAAAALPATTFGTPAAEAGSGTAALALQAPVDATTANVNFTEVCFPGA
jgi:hypothetical protein